MRYLGSVTREAGAVLRWAERGSASHLGAEVGGCPEAAAVGEQVEGRGSLPDQAACEVVRATCIRPVAVPAVGIAPAGLAFLPRSVR
jgi:hypothetical protein